MSPSSRLPSPDMRAAGFCRETEAENPSLRIAANPFRPLRDTYAVTTANRTVFLSVLGVSWFWFFGAAVLALLPIYTKDVLRADEHVITLFLALFCVGIGVGSLLCERLSGHKLELGLVPLGSIGMSLFAFDLFLTGVPPGAALRVRRRCWGWAPSSPSRAPGGSSPTCGCWRSSAVSSSSR